MSMATRIRYVQPIWRLQNNLRHLPPNVRLTQFTRGRPIGYTTKRTSSSSNTETPRLQAYNVSPSFRLTQPPNPSWKLGQGLAEEGVGAKEWKADEQKGWKTWDMQKTPSRDIYRLLTSAVVPRPVAFISSLSAEGVPNLAPFRWVQYTYDTESCGIKQQGAHLTVYAPRQVAHNPPVLSVSFSLPQRRPKDTRQNILATKEFTVNIISEAFAEAANSTSVEAPEDVDEWTVSGLTREQSTHVKPPRVKESAVSMECQLYTSHDICPPNSNEVTNTLVLGLIKMVHVRNAVMKEDGTVNASKLRAISRLGGDVYARIGEGFDIARPSWRAIRDRF